MFYNLNVIKFDLIIYNVINKKCYMFIIKKKKLLCLFIVIIKINNLLKTISMILISLIAMFMFFIKSLIANLNILLLNIKSNFFI